MKRNMTFAIFAAGLVAAALLAGCRPVTLPTTPPQITIANAEDTVTVEHSAGVTVIDVFSPRGIGAAQVRLSPAQARGALQVRFHLQGLEQATFNNGVAQLTVSVSSIPPYAASQMLTYDGGTRPLSADDPLWATVILAANDAVTPTVPLTSGAFVVTLPPAFLAQDASELSLRWIDFYR